MSAALLLAILGAQEWNDVPWEPNAGWKLEGDRIERIDGVGTLWSKEEYGDFALRLEFKLPPGGNSGLLFRSRDNVEHQVELVDDAGRPAHPGSSGAIFRRAAPKSNPAKPAGEWNSLEHFRYTVASGTARRNFTLASTEEQVVAGLGRELGQGLRTWERAFAERGFIPTGIGRWDDYSDAGGYAHLISAAAQWVHFLEGRRDWEIHKVPRLE